MAPRRAYLVISRSQSHLEIVGLVGVWSGIYVVTGNLNPERKDLAVSVGGQLVAWALPVLVLAAGFFVFPALKAVLWPVALVWMGVACFVNVARCGRVHCRFTGPFFLLMAAASLAHGLDIVPFGPQGWTWIGVTTGVGAVVLYYLTERIWGKYA